MSHTSLLVTIDLVQGASTSVASAATTIGIAFSADKEVSKESAFKARSMGAKNGSFYHSVTAIPSSSNKRTGGRGHTHTAKTVCRVLRTFNLSTCFLSRYILEKTCDFKKAS